MNFQVRSKVWIQNQAGMTVIGEGRLRILKAIRETGSISKAAVKLRQPFRRGWARIKDAEYQTGLRPVETKPGGSRLTQDAEALVRKFAVLNKSCTRHANSAFEKLFGDGPSNLSQKKTRNSHP